MKKEFIKIEVHNEELRKLYNVGVSGIIEVQSKRGIPLNREWRNRLKDAAIDKCISLCNNKAKSSKVAKKEPDHASS